jgi:hypothetical protein
MEKSAPTATFRPGTSLMPRAFLTTLFFMGAAGLALADPPTALNALKLIPKEAVPQLTTIEGFGGKPEPDRWNFLAQDPTEESGVHEYVVASGKVLASRTVSQFAEELHADDVVGGDAIKIDSDRAAHIADTYAEASQQKVRAFNFELKKSPEGAIWLVTCVGMDGAAIGKVTINAAKGNVVGHEGFTAEPGAAALAERPKVADNAAAKRVTRPPPPAETPAPARQGFFQKVGKFFGGH